MSIGTKPVNACFALAWCNISNRKLVITSSLFVVRCVLSDPFRVLKSPALRRRCRYPDRDTPRLQTVLVRVNAAFVRRPSPESGYQRHLQQNQYRAHILLCAPPLRPQCATVSLARAQRLCSGSLAPRANPPSPHLAPSAAYHFRGIAASRRNRISAIGSGAKTSKTVGR
jgi:hypothetical protein